MRKISRQLRRMNDIPNLRGITPKHAQFLLFYNIQFRAIKVEHVIQMVCVIKEHYV